MIFREAVASALVGFHVDVVTSTRFCGGIKDNRRIRRKYLATRREPVKLVSKSSRFSSNLCGSKGVMQWDPQVNGFPSHH